jgi:hypothetical protein
MILRWNGYDDVDGSKPRWGYDGLGAMACYRFHADALADRLWLLGRNDRTIAEDLGGTTLATGVRYTFKARVQSLGSLGSLYLFKVWEDGAPEPPGWTLGGMAGPSDPGRGSVLLVANYVDATFGEVRVVPRGDAPLIENITAPPEDSAIIS